MFLQASFLMGIFTANKMLLNGNSSGKIGYLSRKGDDISYRNLNAFSIGVSMVDAGVNIFTDIEYTEGIRRMKWLNKNIIGEL